MGSLHICIVGGGLAGGLLAAKLAEAGRRVTLLEQCNAPAALIPDDEVWLADRPQIAFTRGSGLGGTSNFWHGALVAFDRTDTDAISGGGKRKLPIGHETLRGYYRSALELLTNRTLSLDDFDDVSELSCFPDLDSSKFAIKAHYVPGRPFSTKNLIRNAVDRHGLECRTVQANSVELNDAGRAVAVRGLTSGAPTRVEADVFVLSAGGIGSPKILLKSCAASASLRRLPIGRNSIDHPSGFVFKAKLRERMNLAELFGRPVPGRDDFRCRYGFRLRPEHLDITLGRNHVLYLRPAFGMTDPHEYNHIKSKLVRYRGQRITMREKAELLKYPDLLLESLAFRYGIHLPVQYVSGFLVAEQFPDVENRIELNRDGRFDVRWQVAEEDAASIRRFLSAFLDSHKGVFSEFSLSSSRLDSGAHHSGSCRMATTPSDGVVDDEMRVFGTQNLFIADGSVIGYSGHSNTGLTITALAHRCLEILKRES